MKFNLKLDLVRLAKVLKVAVTAVEGAKAVNSTQVYKHKDKVDKTLAGASKALDAASIVVSVLKKD